MSKQTTFPLTRGTTTPTNITIPSVISQIPNKNQTPSPILTSTESIE